MSTAPRFLPTYTLDDYQQWEGDWELIDGIVSRETVIRPDLMVVCGEQPERHLERRPSLAVEVLSESTRERDLIAKRSLCREHHVPYYLVIDPAPRTLTLFTPDDERTFGVDDTIRISLDDCCGINIQCARLFDRV